MKPMPNLMETELESFGAVDDRGLHLEAALRHRRVHDLRPLHVGVPGARDGQAARPARDRAEGRRGDGRDRRSRRVAAGRRRPRHHGHRRQRVRAHHVRGAVGVHDAARRATRSARSTSRSSTRSSTCAATSRSWRATSPPSSATRTARWRTPANVYGMNQGERGDWADALEGVEIVEAGGAVRPRVPLLRRLRGQLRRPQQEDEPRASPSCCSARASTSRSSARASCATATRPAARATSTSSRCSRCRTSRRSTAWA